MSHFVHLHTHSHYSLLDGLGKIPDLVSRAKELGMEALAITDHGVMYGAIEFYKECQSQGIKPIIGTEMYLSPRRMIDKEPKLDNKPYHIVLLAKNEEGYKNLLKIVTAAHLEGYYYKPRIDKEYLSKHAQGLIGLTACLDGEIPRLILNNKKEKAIQAIKEYQNIFGRDNFFLELQHHPELSEQNKVNQKLIEIAPKVQAGLVATNDIHYVHPGDRDAHEVLLAVQTGKDYNDETRLSLKEFNLSVIPTEEMTQNFEDAPEAISNSVRIAEMCNLQIPLGQTILPKFEIPKGQTAKSYLEKLCREGAQKRFSQISSEIKNRLDYELTVIEKCHFEDYFLIVRDYVKFAKDNQILVGPGRGSAAGSLVSYVLGITDIDPIAYELLFERFLNPERVAPPDIDLDFADDRREKVIQYITRKYGVDHVAQIITFGLMKARMAVRDVARALGMSYDDGDRIAKLIPMGLTLDEALNSIAELQSIYENEPNFKKLIDMAKRLENVARNAGTHAAGVVISQQPLVEYTPLQHPPRGETNIVTQYSMNYLDDIGLLKLDILGLANLTIIRNTLRIIRKIAGKEIELEKIPLDDQKTFELLARAETSGVFQLESDGMKRYLKELRPTQLEDIISMVALYRPGPIESISDFIAAKNGQKRITYLHPKLETILKKTYGVIVTQEQVLEIARALAGFTYAEADILRKAVGKKIKKLLGEQKEKFIKGCLKNEIDQKTAQKLWDFIEPFARYGFNRAHAACYALIAYQTAYLKAHYPSAFMAAWLTAEQQNIDKIAFAVIEARRMKIEVLPPDINESFVEFGVMKESDNIRFGLAAIKNVGVGVSEAITEERKVNGPYLNFEDFLKRLGSQVLNKKVIEALAKSGTLDRFSGRNEILAGMDGILKFIGSSRTDSQKEQLNLFGASSNIKLATLELPQIEEASKKQRLAWEKELLGMYISEHPLKGMEKILQSNGSAIINLDENMNGKKTRLAGIITNVKKITTKSRQPMIFVTLEDISGKAEILVFPKIFQKTTMLWQQDNIVSVAGRINTRDGSLKIIAEEIQEIATSTTSSKGQTSIEKEEKIVVRLPEKAKKDILEKIKAILVAYPGPLPVYLNIPQNGTFQEIKTKTKVEKNQEMIKKLTSLLGRKNIVI